MKPMEENKFWWLMGREEKLKNDRGKALEIFKTC